MKKLYSKEEVFNILLSLAGDYEICRTDKFMMEYCNQCSDAPSDDYIQKKEAEMINTYIN